MEADLLVFLGRPGEQLVETALAREIRAVPVEPDAGDVLRLAVDPEAFGELGLAGTILAPLDVVGVPDGAVGRARLLMLLLGAAVGSLGAGDDADVERVEEAAGELAAARASLLDPLAYAVERG